MKKDNSEMQVESLEEIVNLVKKEEHDFIIHVIWGEESQSGKQ